MSNSTDEQPAPEVRSAFDATACEAGMARALIAAALYGVVAIVLSVVALEHPILFIRLLAGLGVVVSGVFLAYWIWWYRFFKRTRAQQRGI